MNPSRFLGLRNIRSARSKHGRRLSVEALEGRQLLATLTVTNVNDSGAGSLRQAIISSNALSGSSTNAINFQVGGGGAQTIALLSALPGVTHPVAINGFTQPGNGTAPRIVLDGTNAGASSAGLTLKKSNSTVEGLAIDNFAEYGITVSGSSNTIADNYIGLTPGGVVAPNTHNAINLTYATGNTITGNVVSGNHGNGVEVYDSFNNVVTGNLIGTNPAGTAALPNNGNAVKIEGGSKGNVIGGTAPGAGNVLSGNGDCGVQIVDGSSGNLLEGNLIGTNAAGTAVMGNAVDGVYIGNGSDGNSIGGTTPAARNVISANALCGVLIDSGSGGNTVAGNLIGTNAAGTAGLGNSNDGVLVDHGADGNVIGGTAPGAGNVISGNQWRGIQILNGSNGNSVEGNAIGTNAGETAALGNSLGGVLIENGANGNVIGGTTAGAGNVISGNMESGLVIRDGANGNFVEGNAIGTNTAGTAALGNADNGLEVESGSAGNVIGGMVSGAGNTIAYNPNGGVAFIEAGKGNLIEGNVIDANGLGQPTAGLGDGIYLTCSPDSTVSNNTIEFNHDWGINLEDSGSCILTSNIFQGNGLGQVHSS
jgi:parallel beta-helix repeat protein